MERKAKMGLSAMMIVAITFTIIGITFLPIGIIVGMGNMTVDGSLAVFVMVFAGLGALFLGLGIVFLILEIKKYKRNNRLLTEGYYILADVLDVNKNFNVQYGRHGHPYVVRCGYTDEHGTLHIFKSRNITQYPGNDLIGQQVRVYLDRNDYNNFRDYYMDIDEILPRVIEH